MNDLERLWEATRPDAPSAEAWDRVWTSVADRIDAPEPIAIAMPARRRWTAIALVALAQAAAVLLAVGVSRDDPPPAPPVRIAEGRLVLIRGDADSARVVDLAPGLGGSGVDAWYLVHNYFESATGAFVAMAE